MLFRIYDIFAHMSYYQENHLIPDLMPHSTEILVSPIDFFPIDTWSEEGSVTVILYLLETLSLSRFILMLIELACYIITHLARSKINFLSTLCVSMRWINGSAVYPYCITFCLYIINKLINAHTTIILK